MRPFRTAHAAAEDWAHAAQACVDGLGEGPFEGCLGFVYATDLLAGDLSHVLDYLHRGTGVVRWVGSVGTGICAGSEAYFDRPAMAVMIAPLPEGAYCVFPALSESVDQLSSDRRAWIGATAPTFGIVHGDPENPKVPALIEGLAEETGGFLVGGLTSSRHVSHQVAGRITGGGLSGVLFSPEVEVATGLSQGCAPVAGSHVISDCLDNILIGLDGRSALDVFKEDIGEDLARDLNRVGGYIHAALPIEGSDTGDYMVRNLVGIDPGRGWLAIGGQVQPGDRVMFVRRDPESAEVDLKAMVEKIKRRLTRPPRGGLYVSCVARGPHMFGDESREMALVRGILGAVPVVGFYANGEISNNRLYGYTGVLTLFL